MYDEPMMDSSSGNRKAAKRGRLKKMTMHTMYDEDGKVGGHVVTAHHAADTEGAKSGEYMPEPPPAQTSHTDYDSAADKMREHNDANTKRFGGKKKKSAESMPEEMRKAMSR